jgi:hypothetical protein
VLEDLSSLHSTVQLLRMPKRRDSANQLNSEIDAGFNQLTFADDNKLLSTLPRYSVVDTDIVPNMRLFEGDDYESAYMYRIDRFESKMSELFTSMSAMSSCIASVQGTHRDLVNVQQTTNQVNSGGPTAICTEIYSALT